MKMTSGDALAKLKALDLAGAEPVHTALAEEHQSPIQPEKKPDQVPSASGRKHKVSKSTPGVRKSHSKGHSAAIVTGYLDPLHVDVLLELRARSGINALSAPSANLLLKVALRLIKTLKPSDAQILNAFLKEQEGEG